MYVTKYERPLLLIDLACAVAGQVLLSRTPTLAIILLGISLTCTLLYGWIRPRPLRIMWSGIAMAGIIGLAYWREPRGWFFLASALILVGTGMRAQPAQETDPYHSPSEAPGTTELSAPEGAAPPTEPEPRYLTGLLAGLAAAVGGAVIWAFLTITTGWQIGFVAWIIGRGVGMACVKGAGNRGSNKLQIMAAVLGGLGILGGEYLIIRDAVVGFFASEGIAGVPEWETARLVFLLVIEEPGIIGAFGLVFIAIGIFDAWRAAKERPVSTTYEKPVDDRV